MITIGFSIDVEALDHVSISTRRTGILKANKVVATVTKEDDSRQQFLLSALAAVTGRLKLRLDVFGIQAHFADGRLQELRLEDDPLALIARN